MNRILLTSMMALSLAFGFAISAAPAQACDSCAAHKKAAKKPCAKCKKEGKTSCECGKKKSALNEDSAVAACDGETKKNTEKSKGKKGAEKKSDLDQAALQPLCDCGCKTKKTDCSKCKKDGKKSCDCSKK